MLPVSQIKYWVFAAVALAGGYLVANAVFGNPPLAVGLCMVIAGILWSVLGASWDCARDGEAAATYRKQARDEEAFQELRAVQAKGAKQLEAP